ncbi:T9SS type A sorting domain-containing protein [Candidatus Latescibacterota bacterium]
MSRKFYKYGNGRTREQVNEKLVGLVKEALMACKNREGNAIDFSNFDTFMVIHAGIGSETSAGLNDIPSAYISREDFQEYLGSIMVIDGKEIDSGIIVPEKISSIGIGGLNGIMAQMFGHRLGLPSLSNNKDGLPAAGGWCLMDTGGMAWGYRTRGFVPTHPCIWSKIELGWVESVVVTSDTTLDISATHIDNKIPRAVKVPITNDEYLLIENRFNYASRDSLATAVYSDSDTSGVWLEVDHYDAYIPGSGILIWHVNDCIIRENRHDGTINDDPYRRGLDLLEADGQQDIGAYIGFGDPRGEYAEGHSVDTFKLNGRSLLSPTTNPHSGSMWGASSGVTIQINSAPGEIMNVSISFRGKMKGFPLSLGADGNIAVADLDGDGIDELIVSGNDSTLVVTSEGKLVGSISYINHPAVYYDDDTLSNNLVLHLLDEQDRINGYETYAMREGYITAIQRVNMDFIESYCMSRGHVVITKIMDETRFIFDADLQYTLYRSDRISSVYSPPYVDKYIQTNLPDTTFVKSMAVANVFIAVLGENNTLYLGQFGDETLSSYPLDTHESFGPVLADMNRDDKYETILTCDKTIRFYQPDGSFKVSMLSDNPVGAPVAADIDLDGYPEVIQCTEKQIFAFRHEGAIVNGFPFSLPPGDTEEMITSPPIVVDLNNDRRPDIACATSNERLISFDPSGLITPGFPIALAGRVEKTPAVFKRAESDSIAIAYLTDDGMLMAHDLGTTVNDDMYIWPMWKGSPGLTSALLNSKISSAIKNTALFEAYCYPNPITENTGTFRITTTSATDCTITVYTVDGIKIFERHIPEHDIIPGVPNEVTMNASGLASGLYIARIKTRKNSLKYKLGVMK